MALTQKCLSAEFTLSNGTFSGGGNSHTAAGLRMSARIVTPGGDDTGTMELTIFGMTLSEMNQLTVLPTTLTAVGQNTVVLKAGENGTADTIVFQGTIQTAFTDAAAMPEVAFRVQAIAGQVERVKPVPAISHPGGSDVATVAGTIAQSMGRTLENSGVNVVLSNIHLPGTALHQIAAMARHAGIQWALDDNKLAIYPAGQPRNIPPTTISPTTGLVGYPAFTASGIVLTTLYQGSLKFGAKVTVQSQLTPANGDWFVYRIEYALDCQMPNGRWFATLEAGKISSGNNA